MGLGGFAVVGGDEGSFCGRRALLATFPIQVAQCPFIPIPRLPIATPFSFIPGVPFCPPPPNHLALFSVPASFSHSAPLKGIFRPNNGFSGPKAKKKGEGGGGKVKRE